MEVKINKIFLFNSLALTGFPGVSCLKVVEREMGGTIARLFHCSGSCPAWIASVAKCGYAPIVLLVPLVSRSLSICMSLPATNRVADYHMLVVLDSEQVFITCAREKPRPLPCNIRNVT